MITVEYQVWPSCTYTLQTMATTCGQNSQRGTNDVYRVTIKTQVKIEVQRDELIRKMKAKETEAMSEYHRKYSID